MNCAEGDGTEVKTSRAKLSDTIRILEKFVAKPYAGISSLESWPTVGRLNELTALMCKVGRELGIKKFDVEDMSGVLERIDKRYPKMGLGALMEQMILKIEAIPVGPVTRLTNQLDACEDANERKQFERLIDLLKRSDWEISIEPKDLKDLSSILKGAYQGRLTQIVQTCKRSTVRDIDFAEAERMFATVFDWSMFIELQRDRILWEKKWGSMPAVALWIGNFLNDKWKARLLARLFGILPSRDDFRAATRRDQERVKKRRYRSRRRKIDPSH
jgi:hypothetical protein